ncbi:hypothetical protein [Salarchaeum sp. JOR-1]|uniref:hypothetical protein n=1 Tax=Salarchaeum sp. JOR-1 TaxID=2599399 RepID=UPI001198965C|nr:hypothetical protein [Salarchaeum sp. JOR-1]QDX39849.1 hypothetical protein FQU85_02645 [Salarchaeum sp. JOR-1]
MWRDLLKYALLAAGGWIALGNEIPQAPEWLGVAVLALVLVAVAVMIATGRLDDLLPDPPRVTLYVINDEETEVIEEWELSPDQFADAQVNGQLNHLPECKTETYECRAYHPEENVIEGTWRGSVAASDTIGASSATDALNAIEEVRGDLEDQARYGERLQRHLPSVVRTLDRLRAMEQNRALSPHLTPSVGGGDTVTDVIQNQMPDSLLPERMQMNEASTTDEHDDDADELLHDLANVAGVTDAEPATDGGGNDERE